MIFACVCFLLFEPGYPDIDPEAHIYKNLALIKEFIDAHPSIQARNGRNSLVERRRTQVEPLSNLASFSLLFNDPGNTWTSFIAFFVPIVCGGTSSVVTNGAKIDFKPI